MIGMRGGLDIDVVSWFMVRSSFGYDLCILSKLSIKSFNLTWIPTS